MVSHDRLPLSELVVAHTPAAIRERLNAGPAHSYVRDFVYGGIDGAVTTFAVVSGVAGAELSAGIVIVLGLANLAGDGFSMAASNFLGTRAEHQLLEGARRAEEFHLANFPEGEREEIRQIFANKGFAGEDLDRAVNIITSDKKQWINTMLREELGLRLEGPSAWRAALSTFVAFICVGVLPLLPFICQSLVPASLTDPFFLSALMTGVAFFAVGALKGRFVERPWYSSGVETLSVGGGAAIFAYLIGLSLKGFA
jgi:vacuolar iron transporter family protein